MTKKKLRRIKRQILGYLIILTFLIFCIIIVYFSISLLFKIFNDNSKDEDVINNNDNKLYSEYITNNSESDTDIIEKIFADGMPESDYKVILDKLNDSPNYIKKVSKYSQIKYNFENQLHYSEIEEYLLQLNNSNIVKLEVIGESVDGRNIYGVEIGKGTKVLYLDANVHAAEISNTLMLLKFMTEIVNKYEDNDSDIINTLNNITIAIIPTINPDGYEIYNYGVESLNNKNLWWYTTKDSINFENIKSNANGVDLNRNFPTQNAGMYYKTKKLINSVSLDKTTAGLTYFGGYSLGSEPETKAAMYFMLKHYKNIYAYMNMHNQGRIIYAGKPNLSDEFNNLTISFGKKVSNYTDYSVKGLSSEEVGEGNDGSVTDFIAELANGFIYSNSTNRLSTDKYIDNSCTLKYSFPVITIETTKDYTRDTKVFYDEYYNYGIRNLLFALLNPNFNN